MSNVIRRRRTKEHNKKIGEANFKHGRNYGDKTYRTWSNIKKRCNNPNRPDYARYGGRGIKVCERWMTFTNFLEDMGESPEELSIDRIDVNGDYEPSNCRWATRSEQARNKRGTNNPVH